MRPNNNLPPLRRRGRTDPPGVEVRTLFVKSRRVGDCLGQGGWCTCTHNRHLVPVTKQPKRITNRGRNVSGYLEQQEAGLPDHDTDPVAGPIRGGVRYVKGPRKDPPQPRVFPPFSTLPFGLSAVVSPVGDFRIRPSRITKGFLF